MNERGFTLMEVLIALGAASLLLIPLGWAVAGLGGELRDAKVQNSETREYRDIAVLQDMLKAARFTDHNGKVLPVSNKSVQFRTAAPQAFGRSGLMFAQLDVIREQDISMLALSFPGTDVPQQVFLKDQGEITLSKRASEKGGAFPAAVEIILQKPGQDPHTYVFQNIIDADGACIFDQISLKCR